MTSTDRGAQAERTRLAWSRSVLSLLGLLFLDVRVLVAGHVATALVVAVAGVAAALVVLYVVARRHPRSRQGGGALRADLDGHLPALTAGLGALVGLGSLVLVLS
ncbi:hypothetical protein GCM10022237_33440 [Nocardioides ginsengisoli]|uniref:DUF202 domain-containing protein n=1 Tax=Nocardioides ginsengisoli TaxID=363868 RepID=A0ABW3VWL3_9ACTN